MTDAAIAMQVSALVASYLLGMGLRHFGRLGPAQGGALLRVVVNLGLPPLAFSVIHAASFDAQTLGLSLTAATAVLVAWPVGLVLAAALRLDRPGTGSLVLCGMSINVAFTMPFVLVILGSQAFAALVLFDIGNAISQWTLTSFVSAWHGGRSGNWRAALRTMLTTLPFWAIPLGIATNLADVPLSDGFVAALRHFGQAVVLVVPFAMGVLTDMRRLGSRSVLAGVLLRSVVGFLVASVAAGAMGLADESALIATLAASAPIGFSAVVIANRDRLDVPMVANASSLSILLALVWMPAALLCIRSWTATS